MDACIICVYMFIEPQKNDSATAKSAILEVCGVLHSKASSEVYACTMHGWQCTCGAYQGTWGTDGSKQL